MAINTEATHDTDKVTFKTGQIKGYKTVATNGTNKHEWEANEWRQNNDRNLLQRNYHAIRL